MIVPTNYDVPIDCEHCWKRQAREQRGGWWLCDSCADERDQALSERDYERVHGGTDAWPCYLRGLV